MIELRESQIAQVMPEYFSQNASVQALSYALGAAVKRLINYCGNIGVFSVIDTAPDYVLDMLALELNTPYYDDSLRAETKRILIKNTFVWYMKAGTPAAVEELVKSVFGHGKVHEWYQYGGEPYAFRLTTNADAKLEAIDEFEKLINRVKNIRSHIDGVMFVREQETMVYMAAANIARVLVKTGWEERDGNL